METPVIFDYLDYRSYLRDMFAYRKAKIRHYSYRYFSRKSGFKSPNFLKLVTSGQRNLGADSISKIAKGFALKKQEAEYLTCLVRMNQAATHADKNRYYRKMMSIKGYRSIRRIEAAAYDYFSTWYYPVIREIVMSGTRDQGPAEIADRLRPPITAKEAEKALVFLLELGLIERDPDGRWSDTGRNLTTGAEVRSWVIANYHREMMRLAAESIERFPAAQRDITALVLSIRSDRMAEIKETTARFRKALLEIASEDPDPDRVIQVNIQIFPLTDPKQGNDRHE